MKFVITQHNRNTTRVKIPATDDLQALRLPCLRSILPLLSSQVPLRVKACRQTGRSFSDQSISMRLFGNHTGKNEQQCTHTACDTQLHTDLFLKIIPISVAMRITSDNTFSISAHCQNPVFHQNGIVLFGIVIRQYPKTNRRIKQDTGNQNRQSHNCIFKKPKDKPSGSKADCAIIFPGAPISDRFPPIAAAKTSGISRRDLL